LKHDEVLKEVRVKDKKTGKEWVFKTDRWLATDEGDGKISVDFTPSPYVDRRLVFTTLLASCFTFTPTYPIRGTGSGC
jgi:hypothetical protein